VLLSWVIPGVEELAELLKASQVDQDAAWMGTRCWAATLAGLGEQKRQGGRDDVPTPLTGLLLWIYCL